MIQAVPISDCVAPVESRDPARDNPNGTFCYIDLSSVDKDRKVIDTDLIQKIETQDAPSRARQMVNAGDILVSTVRPNLNGVAFVPQALDGATASTGYCVLRCNKRLDPLYLYYWVQTPDFVSDMVRKATGANYPAVTDRVIKNSMIPLPPLETQKHIARVLEQADQLRKQAQQMESELNQLSQSLFLEMFGDPVTNSKKWKTVNLGSLVEVTSGATPSKSNKRFWLGTFPWVSPKDMKSVEIRDAIDHINECVFAETNLKRIDEGSILIVVRGMILAHTVPIAITTAPVAINQDIKALRVVDENMVDPRYLLACLVAMHDKLLGVVSTAAHGTKRIETTDLSTLNVPVPPMASQHEFCKAISILREQFEASIVSKHHYENMFQALMQRAFKGDLTAPGSKAA